VTKLHLGRGIELPIDAVTDTIGVLAVKGAGKTYTFLVLVEEMVKAKIPVVVVDPVGVCWGLRASADGKWPGLAVTVLGGRHGDAPLEASAGRVVADLVVETRTPCYGRRYTLAEAWAMAGGCMRLRQRVVACDRRARR